MKNLSFNDLIEINWDYSRNAVVGLYDNREVCSFLFEVKGFKEVKKDGSLGMKDGICMLSCNAKKGEISYMQILETGEPVLGDDSRPKIFKKEHHGEVVIFSKTGEEIISFNM